MGRGVEHDGKRDGVVITVQRAFYLKPSYWR